MTHAFLFSALVAFLPSLARAADPPKPDLFAPDNLVAWCIVPFDAKKRGPTERVEMLQKLGFKKYAYDWRDRPVPSGAKYECYNPRAGVFERVRPGERQDDLDFSRCHSVGGDWRHNRGSDSGPYECWNPRARTYERVREGEVQNDLDFGRCRGTAPERYR